MRSLALLTDFPQEHWPSMDLVAEMLGEQLRARHANELAVTTTCAAYRERFVRLPVIGKKDAARNVDRLYNRFVIYPRFAKTIPKKFDLFHLADHSYAQVLHALPADRTGVFCHDLDTFRCVLDPAAETRPKWFRAMATRILRGMEKAAVVFHSTDSVRQQILKYKLVGESRLVAAPYGTSIEYCPEPQADDADKLSKLIAPRAAQTPYLLHVGSCIPRKRMDVLLGVFARARELHPEMILVQAGGVFTAEQRDLIAALGIGDAVVQTPRLDRPTVAALYRQAKLVLMPSESEGFGLPVAEALACGAPVLASDIPVLREVGGTATTYAPLADLDAWGKAADAILVNPDAAPPFEARLARAMCFSWARHADVVAGAYRVLGDQ